MRRESGAGVIVGALFVGALVLGAVAVASLGTTRTESSRSSSVTLGNPDDTRLGDVVVTGKTQSGGTSIFGIQFGHVTYRVGVRFIAAPGCYESAAFGDRWPISIDECSVEVPIEGEISGGGTTSTGDSIIEVLVEVPGQCFDAAVVGDTWPPPQAATVSQVPDPCATLSP